MLTTQLTIVILAHNEADNLRQLLPQICQLAPVLVIDHQSTDDSSLVLADFPVACLHSELDSFAQLRQLAMTAVTTPWIFYLDADERLTPALWQEIIEFIAEDHFEAATLSRQNYCYGHLLTHGGWNCDFVTRIFKLTALENWFGEIHESPKYSGSQKVLKSPLVHLTHRSTAANLLKSSQWTIKEAQALATSGLPPVTRVTILRKVLAEFWRRYFLRQGYRDGMVGFIESLVQAFNRGFVYIQVWELSQKPTLSARYQAVEKDISRSWQRFFTK